METPKLHIAGREITPHPPKMKVWREFLAFFDADKEGLSLEDFLDEHVRLIVLGFGREEVTRESVEENVDVADIVPLTRNDFFERDDPNGNAGDMGGRVFRRRRNYRVFAWVE